MEGQNSVLGLIASLSRKQKILFFGAISIVVLVIVLIIVFASQKTNLKTDVKSAASHIDITNFDEYAPNIPDFYKHQVEALIYDTLVDYNGMNKDSSVEAKIRDGSYSETPYGQPDDSAKINDSKFIVDIPSLEKSFVIEFGWQAGQNNPRDYDFSIDCPSYTEWIYKNHSCAISNNPIDILTKYLPMNIESNPPLALSTLTYGEYSKRSGNSYLMVDIGGCEDADKLVKAKDIVKKWLEERYVDPSHIYIEYAFTSAICNR